MPHQPSCTVRLHDKAKNLNNSGQLTRLFREHIENKPKKLGVGKTLLTTSNQYINDFMKKLIIYIARLNGTETGGAKNAHFIE